MQACNTETCPAYIFQTSMWSVCTKKCGSGVATRHVFCEQLSTGSAVADSLCLAQTLTTVSVRPEESRACNTLPCLSDGLASWVIDTVSPCDHGGGVCGGIANRTITCRCAFSSLAHLMLHTFKVLEMRSTFALVTFRGALPRSVVLMCDLQQSADSMNDNVCLPWPLE